MEKDTIYFDENNTYNVYDLSSYPKREKLQLVWI